MLSINNRVLTPIGYLTVDYLLKNKLFGCISKGVSDITNFLNIIVNDGKTYDIFNLPDNLVINGDLNLIDKEIKKLPNGLQVIGNLDLDRSKIIELPANLKISGSLSLYKTKIIKLPKNLEIGDNLDLRYTKITTLSEDLKVDTIWISPKMKLKNIPKHLVDKILVYP